MSTAAAAPGPNTTALAWLIGNPASTAVVSSQTTIDLLSMNFSSTPKNSVTRSVADTAVSLLKHDRLSIDAHQHRTCIRNIARAVRLKVLWQGKILIAINARFSERFSGTQRSTQPSGHKQT
jgi:hypothetical protein